MFEAGKQCLEVFQYRATGEERGNICRERCVERQAGHLLVTGCNDLGCLKNVLEILPLAQRGFEKKPFELPDFIVKTGIAEVRDSLMQDEIGQSAKQKNRSRVSPKMGAIDIDYRTLHDAFFRHQSKPSNLTKVGDLYHEGKELETNVNIKPGGPYSEALLMALGMSDNSPPPWLNNMQRYGPPPSYPALRLPGLNAQLPNDQCQYGYHPGGWGKPPIDPYGRPMYGGNPFDPPGKASRPILIPYW